MRLYGRGSGGAKGSGNAWSATAANEDRQGTAFSRPALQLLQPFLLIGIQPFPIVSCFLLYIHLILRCPGGQPFEKVVRNIVRAKLLRPGVRPYRTENLYAPFAGQVEKEEPIAEKSKTQMRPRKG